MLFIKKKAKDAEILAAKAAEETKAAEEVQEAPKIEFVKCPKCGKEMGSGFLQTGNIIAFNKTFISLPLDEGMFSFHIIHWDKSVIGVFAPLSVLSAFHGASPKLCGNSPRQRPALSLFTERQYPV